MKIPIIFIIAMMVMSVTVSALSTPMPVSIKIENEGVLSGIIVKVTNIDTRESKLLTSDANGWSLFDWSNSNLGWDVGDKFEAVVMSCESNPICRADGIIESSTSNHDVGKPLVIIIRMTGEICPVPPVCQECESCETCQIQVCPTCPICPNCPDCPTCPTCPTCPVCDKCPICEQPNTLLDWILGLICTVLGINTLREHYRKEGK